MKVSLFALLTSLFATAALADVLPSRKTIERHTDPSVQVNGKFAAVRLPIKNGPKLWNPSRITITPDGLVFVANYTGEILTLHDTDSDGLEDTTRLFVDLALIGKPADAPRQAPGTVPTGPALRYPTAMTHKDGWLYVGTTQAIHRFRIGADSTCTASELFASGWPYTMHAFDWTFGLRFGSDGWLYAILTTDYLNPQAAPDPDGLRGSMIRISPDGKKIERFASGLRFPYGLAIHHSGNIFFTDNRGSDKNLTEELNHAVAGGNYGHNPKNTKTSERLPILDLTSEASPVGCAFAPRPHPVFGNDGNELLIAYWGNDGAWKKGGIGRVKLTPRPNGTFDAVEEIFATGPAKLADLDFAPNGDIYAARFGIEAESHAPHPTPEGDVYRLIQAPWIMPQFVIKNPLLAEPGNPVAGREVFSKYACASCHSADRSASGLGPDLADIALTMGRDGLMESIDQPSLSIKTDYETNQITLQDGSVLIGCVHATDDQAISVKMPGGLTQRIDKTTVKKIEILPHSLMPAGLLQQASSVEKNDLFSYLESLAIDRSLRLNVGGPAAKLGDKHFLADKPYEPGGYGYVGGMTTFAQNTDTGSPLDSCRYEKFSYRFDCTNGVYDVTLYFADHWFQQPGDRIFHMALNGQQVLTDLDLVRTVGTGQVFRKNFRVSVTDGFIEITSQSKVNFPLLNAIEIQMRKKP